MSPALQAWIGAGQEIELLGQRIFLRRAVTAGKPPLLLIHGFPTASYDWHRLWDTLARDWSLYAPDLLGYGRSAKPSIGYSIGLQADLCLALLRHCRVAQPVTILAHDYGDTVAQELLARQREGQVELRRVTFLNGGLFPEAHRPRLVQRLLALPLLGQLLARALGYRRFAASMRAIGGSQPPPDTELRDLWTLLQHDGGRRVLPRLLGYMAERRLRRTRWVGALLDTRVPLQLVCGAADPISGAHLAARWRELLPQAGLVLLDGVGHYPQLEAPDAVLAAFAGAADSTAPQRASPR